MRFGAIVLVGFAIVLGMVQPVVEATTLRVPQAYKDVGEALREASYGDSVLVSPGRYKVQAKLRSGIVLLSTDGPESTVLWNQRWHILLLPDCDLATVVSGFTFDGKGSNVCISCTTGAPMIMDNILRESWDGVNLYRCNALIKGNIITGCNRGIHMEYSDPEFIENELRRNGDAVSMISSSPVIARCTFEHNGRAILILGHSYPVIGGTLEAANDILTNGYTIYNQGFRIDGTQFTDQREVAIATHNYWGTECPNISRFRGDVAIVPWTNTDHDTLFEKCPDRPASKGTE